MATGDTRYYYSPSAMSAAQAKYNEGVKEFSEEIDQVISQLKELAAAGVWEGTEAAGTWQSSLDTASTKLKTIATNLKQNTKMFSAVKTYIDDYDTKMNAHVKTMVA